MSIMLTLQQVALQMNIVVVCTIHRPSSRVFEIVDWVMVRSRGLLACNGAATNAFTSFLEEIGRPVPPNEGFSFEGFKFVVSSVWDFVPKLGSWLGLWLRV